MGLSWLYNNQDFTEDLINEYYGFVYRITNNTTGKQYIGKKFFYSFSIFLFLFFSYLFLRYKRLSESNYT